MKLIIAFLLIGSISHSQEQNENAKMRVTILDDKIKESHFPKGIKFDKRKRKMSFSPASRDLKFEKLKLTAYASKMDELGKDLLYMDLKNNSAEEIVKTYPTIPAQVLKDAKKNFNQ